MNWRLTVSPVVGVLDLRSPRAMTIFVKSSRVPVLAFDEDMFMMLHLMGRLLYYVKSHIEDDSNDENQGTRLKDHLDNDPTATDNLMRMMVNYAAFGNVVRTPRIEKMTAKDQLNAFLLTRAMELFAIGHEYAHIIAQDVPESIVHVKPDSNGESEIALWSWVQETLADSYGNLMSIHATLPSVKNIPLSYVGGDCFFTCLNLLERTIQVLETGFVDEQIGMTPAGTHPPAFFRRHVLRWTWQERLREGHYSGLNGGKPLDPSPSFALGQAFEEIAEELWRRIAPGLQRLHDNGARPASRSLYGFDS